MYRVVIGRTTRELYLGDITSLDVEAIVNAANNEGWMGGGVARAIRYYGGGELVHKDPEYDRVQGLKALRLPYRHG